MIPDVKPGQPITAEHINRIKRHASRPHTGEGIFETDDFIAHRTVSEDSSDTGMRWVAIAGALPVSTDMIAVYAVTRNGSVFSLDLGDDGLPRETEVVRVWPHMVAQDYFPFFILTGAAGGQQRDYASDGVLNQSTTICPAYLVDGEWWVHNTAKMSWAVPDESATFSSCGSRIGVSGSTL